MKHGGVPSDQETASTLPIYKKGGGKESQIKSLIWAGCEINTYFEVVSI